MTIGRCCREAVGLELRRKGSALRGVRLLAAVLLLGCVPPASAFEVQCGSEGGDAFGWAVASGADYNGDSTPDIAVSAPCSWVGSSIRAGRVKVFSGANGALLLSIAGSDSEQLFGSALDWIPDLDADGRAELVIGSATFTAPKQGGGVILGAGKVEVRSSQGGVLWTVFGPTASGSFGETLSVVPDVDGDGKLEVAVGASGTIITGLPRGAAFLLSGSSGAQITRNNGTEEGELWGSLVGSAGDINGDGTGDWFSSTRIAGLGDEPPVQEGGVTTTSISTTTTTLAPRAGRLTVLSGEAPYGELQSYHGATLVDRLGRAAASAGDLNGDLLDDLWIGSPGAEPSMLDDAGQLTLFSATGSVLQEITEPTPQQSAVFGTSLVVPGSLDGGTVVDVVAGAPNGRVMGKSQAGRVHAFSGEDGEQLWTQSGTLALQRFGQSLDSGFDYDSDDVPDVLVGAPGDSPGGKRGAGTAVVLSGADGDELARFAGRRGRETRIFVAGPDLTREPVVRGFDSYSRRREVEIHPFRGQTTTALSLAIVNAGRREETQNGFRTLLAIGTGRGGSKPEVAVYRAARRRHRVSRFAAGPDAYTGGLNVTAGNFYVETGDELATVPADASGVTTNVKIFWAQFIDPNTGRIDWSLVREFPLFAAPDKFNNQAINAVGANLAAGDLVKIDAADVFDEIVAAPASGLPVVRVYGRAGALVKEWLAYPPGDLPEPNSGVVLAVGDLDGEGRPEIVTVPAKGQPWIAAWNADGSAFEFAPGQDVSFIPADFGLQFGGGLTVATADVDLDGAAEIIVAPGAGVTGRILAFERDGSPVAGWIAFEPFGPLGNKGLGLVGLDQFWRR